MYVLASKIKQLPVLSLQTGETVARIGKPLINVASLEIIAFYCEVLQKKRPALIMIRDIRQLALDCAIIDNEDELTDPADVVRLQSIMADAYEPLQKIVVSDTGRKLGSVEDYTINLDSSRIQKLYIHQPIWRSWLGASLIIDRSQIIDITPKQIVVQDATLKLPIGTSKALPDRTS